MPPVSYISDTDTLDIDILGVVFEGKDTSFIGDNGTYRLLEINPYLPKGEQRWQDIFPRKNGTFSYAITTNASFINVSNSRGSITAPGNQTDVRAIISVNWDKAPSGLTDVELVISSDENRVKLVIPTNKLSIPKVSATYVESGGAVSTEAAHYASADPGYIEIPACGRTLSAVKRWPANAPSTSAPSGSRLTYKFHTSTSASTASLTLHLGQTGNVDPSRPLKYAYSIDGNESTIIQPIATYAMGDQPKDWTSVVKNQVRYSTNEVDLGKPRSHILDIWLLEPEVIFTKIMINLGGERTSYSGPPESRRVG